SDADAEDLKTSGYVTLALKDEKALAEYVASLLNTEVGRSIREQLSGGATMPSLRRSSLAQMALPLPDLQVQRQVVGLRQRARDMRAELEDIESALTDRPRDAARLKRRLN